MGTTEPAKETTRPRAWWERVPVIVWWVLLLLVTWFLLRRVDSITIESPYNVF